ncbi:MAG: hypothetical protein J6U88_00160, partial [Bacteroidales bacterium]|nr:hypothetical protein [Bacteroidales bacterium]
LSKFVAAGCLTQLNAKALLDKKRASFAHAALRHGLVHCIGSDAHDIGRVGANFDRFIPIVKSCGIRYSVRYEQRVAKPELL